MKNNLLSLVLLTTLAVTAPLHSAATAATETSTTTKKATRRPQRPAKKRPTKKSWLRKKLLAAKVIFKGAKRMARKNWANFAKANPNKARAIQVAGVLAALGVTYATVQGIRKMMSLKKDD